MLPGYLKVSSLFHQEERLDKVTPNVHAINNEFELMVDEFVRGDPDISAYVQKSGRKLKAHIAIMIPPEDALDIASYRIVGGLPECHKSKGLKTREDWVGRQVSGLVKITTVKDLYGDVTESIKGLRPKSGIVAWSAQGKLKESRGLVMYMPVVVGGKPCVVINGIELLEKPEDFPGSEINIAANFLHICYSKIISSPAFPRFAQANLREYITVDYPRKFVWHSSLFTVKNTFLEFMSPASDEDKDDDHASFAGHSLRSKDEYSLDVVAGMKSAWTSALPKPVVLDIKRMFSDQNTSSRCTPFLSEKRTKKKNSRCPIPWEFEECWERDTGCSVNKDNIEWFSPSSVVGKRSPNDTSAMSCDRDPSLEARHAHVSSSQSSFSDGQSPSELAYGVAPWGHGPPIYGHIGWNDHGAAVDDEGDGSARRCEVDVDRANPRWVHLARGQPLGRQEFAGERKDKFILEVQGDQQQQRRQETHARAWVTEKAMNAHNTSPDGKKSSRDAEPTRREGKKTGPSTMAQEKYPKKMDQKQNERRPESWGLKNREVDWTDASSYCSHLSLGNFLGNNYHTQSEGHWGSPETVHPVRNEGIGLRNQPHQLGRETKSSTSSTNPIESPVINSPHRHASREAYLTSLSNTATSISWSPRSHSRNTSYSLWGTSVFAEKNRVETQETYMMNLGGHSTNSQQLPGLNRAVRAQPGKLTASLPRVGRRENEMPRMNGKSNTQSGSPEWNRTELVTTSMPSRGKKKIFKAGDRVQLHSFENATWLNGLMGTVNKVFRESRSGRHKRRDRVQITYDELHLAGKKGYPATIYFANVWHM